jgi:hypothetical protein
VAYYDLDLSLSNCAGSQRSWSPNYGLTTTSVRPRNLTLPPGASTIDPGCMADGRRGFAPFPHGISRVEKAFSRRHVPSQEVLQTARSVRSRDGTQVLRHIGKGKLVTALQHAIAIPRTRHYVGDAAAQRKPIRRASDVAKWCGPNGVGQMVWAKWCGPNGVEPAQCVRRAHNAWNCPQAKVLLAEVP